MTDWGRPKTGGWAAAWIFAHAACGGAALQPSSAAQRAAGVADVAIAREGDVTLLANAQAWPGSPRIARQLTPIRLEIENAGPIPIVTSWRDIRLVADNDVLEALPPDDIDLEPQATTVGMTSGDFDSKSGVYEYRTHSPAKTALLRQVRSLSLEVGALGRGERATGFVYFEPVPEGADSAVLEVAVRNQPDGAIEAVLTVPFARR